jgi:TolB protein
MNRFLPSLALALALPLALPLVASAAQDTSKSVHLGINLGVGMRPGIAVLPVRGDHGDSVRAILQRDLDNGDRVNVVGMNNPDDIPPVSGEPNRDTFAKLGVAGVVAATVTADGLHITLYDISGKAPTPPLIGMTLQGAALSGEWRMSVHMASDEIEAWATGVHGIAATRIAFVRDGKIWHVDSDGENAVAVPGTEGGRYPAWHPSLRFVAYSTLPDDASAGGIVVRDLVSGAATRMTQATKSGSWAAPAFSPDGKSLMYAYGLDRGTDLYSMDWPKTGVDKRITADGSNNTSPTFSQDGHQIAFTSGRLGVPEVYIADADGNNAQRLTSERFTDESYRSNPAWSPDGRQIAYQSRINGQFQVVTISPTGKNVVSLTNDSQNENPSWAPDGRHLVFTSRRTGVDQLWILDTESARPRQLTHASSKSSSAAWSSRYVAGATTASR